MLGPILFSIYPLSLSTVLDKHNLCHDFYANDTQIHLQFHPKCTGFYDESKSRLESCNSDVRIWMANNFLKLNDSKSEFFILRPSRQSAHLSKVPAPLAIGRRQVSPAVSARNIRVTFDETMSMDKQIRQVCKSAFHQLHNTRSIRKFLDRDALQTLVHALVTSKLDSFNSLYSGLPVCQIMKVLQRVQNAAARLVLGIPRCEHITPCLKSLHWLPVEKKVVFKLCLLVCKTRHCLPPSYLCGLLLPYAPARQLRSGSRNLMVVPRAQMQTYGNCLLSIAASECNQLPECIRRQESMAAFTVSLKIHGDCIQHISRYILSLLLDLFPDNLSYNIL